MSLHRPPHDLGQIVFALLGFDLVCKTRRMGLTNQDNSSNVALSDTDSWTKLTFRYLPLISSSRAVYYTVNSTRLVPY